MPVYPYKCPQCEYETDVIREIADRDNICVCPHCSVFMDRKFAAPRLGKGSYQFKLYDSKGGTVATGRGGSKKGRWYRP